LPFAHGDLRQHVLQHLIIGMVAPLALVLGAPITLVLRSLPVRRAARIGRVLRSRPVRVVANPVSALALNLGGLVALYFTPLYRATETSPVIHHRSFHFLAAGALFAWVIAGPDPVSHRLPVPKRLIVLGVAIAAHAIVAQLLYAGLYVQVDAPIAQLRGAGSIMYFGGDLAELLLAFAMVRTWRRRRPSLTRGSSRRRGDGEPRPASIAFGPAGGW
jgi:putative membrane protein